MSRSLHTSSPLTTNKYSSLHDAYAADYDRQVGEYGSYLAEALFGLCYASIQPGERLLDVGIGTGLSSALFAKAGMQVYGMDFSPEMLKICQAKGIGVDLKLQDVQQFPWPYPDGFFDSLVCCGVLHFIPAMEGIFGEARRVLRAGSSFSFTTKVPSSSSEGKYEHVSAGDFDVYAHPITYISELIQQSKFEQYKRLVCLVGKDAFCVWLVQGK